MSRATRRKKRRISRLTKQGLPPGTPVYTGEPREERVEVEVFAYDATELREGSSLGEVRADRITWVNVDGIHRVEEVQALCQRFGVHPLWVEDILNPGGLNKAESLGDQLLVITKMCMPGADGVESEQISLVLGPRFVLTFQEAAPGDAWDAVRDRLRRGNGRLRRMDASTLFHALLDAVVDRYFGVIESLESRVDELEEHALIDPDHDVMPIVYRLRSEIAAFRQIVMPMRGSAESIVRGDTPAIGEEIRPFFRDLHDHVVLALNALDASRERLVAVVELHLAVQGRRLNEVMRVLTVMGTIFLPLTFIAGVYGMNFEHMPELGWRYGYPAVLVAMGALAAGMALWFRTRKWW